MTVYDNPDARVVELNHRARLLRKAALAVHACHRLHHCATDMELLADCLAMEAAAVAAEAMMIVVEEGAQPGEAYYHEVDSGLLCLGSAIPSRIVETVHPGGEAL